MRKLLTLLFVSLAFVSFAQTADGPIYQKIDQITTFKMDQMRSVLDTLVKSKVSLLKLTATDFNVAVDGTVTIDYVNGSQAKLVSGTNIKTVGGVSLLGSGNVTEVTQTITNGVTTTTPSEDAVFDALALKAERTREYGIACSDLVTALTTGTSKAYFRIPRGLTVTAVRASVLTAQSSGSILTINIKESGTTILSTKLTIDNSEKTSTTAATAAVISDTALADDAEITIDIDQVGSSSIGLIVWIIGY